MKWNDAMKWGIRSIFLGLTFILFQQLVFAADPPAPSEKTIVLDESQIKGTGPAKGTGAGANEARPALSTALSWEGEEERENPNLAREIFRQLAQPDPAYFMEDRSRGDEPTKGD